MTGEKIAAIIPIYAKVEEQIKWLGECLESVVKQADEVVVWDDGSPISLEPVVRKYPEVTFLGDVHRGKSYSRNMAVGASTSELIFPVDADDILLPVLDVMRSEWRGIPLYGDLVMLDGDTRGPFSLVPFDCDLMQQQCISSVNVLHSKKQWEMVGGWDESLNVYEDWLYNAKLFWMFCAKKLSTPIIEYRQHKMQSTKTESPLHMYNTMMGVKLLIGDYVRRNEMPGCCGKKRRIGDDKMNNEGTNMVSLRATTMARQELGMSVIADLAALGDPGPGKIWARYVGGRGMGPHGRRGMNSRRKYMPIQWGEVHSVNTEDAVTPEEFEAGKANCGFVSLKTNASTMPPVQSTPSLESAVERKAIQIERKMVPDSQIEEYKKQLSTMSVKEIKSILDGVEFSRDDLATFLQAEQSSNSPRIGVIKMLQKIINKQTQQ
jgi:hypothetical protein